MRVAAEERASAIEPPPIIRVLVGIAVAWCEWPLDLERLRDLWRVGTSMELPKEADES